MKISEIFENAPELEVENIMTDSRVKTEKSIFFCIVGLINDGHKYIEQAIDNGAICVVHSKDLEKYYTAKTNSNTGVPTAMELIFYFYHKVKEEL